MWSRIAAGYLKRVYKILLWAAAALLCFAAISLLYGLTLAGTAYAALLSVSCGALLLLIDFARYAGNCRALERYLALQEPVIEDFPKAMDYLEQDYQRLAAKLYQSRLELERQHKLEQADLLDYYTLWVHQIKTPISALRLLLCAEEGSSAQEMSMELFKIEQYTDMVLQYLRLGSSVNDFILQPYDLDDIIRQALRKYARLFIGQKLSAQFRETHRRVLTDEKWLLFVIEQVLSNALKYTPKGEIRIYWEEPEFLVIEDTGIGISTEDLPRIFEKGYTGFNGRKDKKATGLGLFLCRQVCEKLSCRIEAQSQPGCGTRILLALKTYGQKSEGYLTKQ